MTASKISQPAVGSGEHVAEFQQDRYDPDERLLAEVDFKWLMAGHGWWIDATRFHSDAPYATRFLDSALASQYSILRDSAAWLQLQCPGSTPVTQSARAA